MSDRLRNLIIRIHDNLYNSDARWDDGNPCWQEMRDVVHAKAESPWQPMDTAPKDRPILGRADGVCAVVEWWERGEWWLTVFDADSDDGGEWTPDEWMEIPE